MIITTKTALAGTLSAAVMLASLGVDVISENLALDMQHDCGAAHDTDRRVHTKRDELVDEREKALFDFRSREQHVSRAR